MITYTPFECLTFYLSDSTAEDTFCHQIVCGALQPCATQLPPCHLEMELKAVSCIGQSTSGNWEYSIVLSVPFVGTNNSPFLLTSAQGNLYNFNSSVLQSGITNVITFNFTDFPPLTQYMCLDFTLQDSVNGYCYQQLCFPLPNCLENWCVIKPTLIDIQCNNATPNLYDYNIMLEFVPPFDGILQVVSQMGFVNLSPYPMTITGGVLDTAYFSFNDSLHIGFACFKVIASDTTGLHYCADSLCFELPQCQNPVAKTLAATLTIAPNPNEGNCIISYNFTEAVENPELEIIDAQGRSLHKIPLRGMAGYVPIDMRLAKGVYPVFLNGNGKRITMQKWVVK